MPTLKLLSTIGTGALMAAGLMAAAPALAQTTVEEITVTGTWGPDGEPSRLSAPVSYADLDITTQAGQDELKRRVKATADDLCRRLGEPTTAPPGPVTRSCRQDAVQQAQNEVNTAIARAVPRPAGWVPAPMAAAEPMPAAPAASTYAEPAAATMAPPATPTTRLVTNGPVPDTPENRDRYGQPLSNAGKRTQPAGN